MKKICPSLLFRNLLAEGDYYRYYYQMRQFDFLKNSSVVFLCFLFVIFILYGQSVVGDFVLDDRHIVEYAETLSDFEHVERVVMHPFWHQGAGLYRPVTLLSFTLNFVILGDDPAFFHFINLVLYVFICLFIFLLLKRLFKEDITAFTAALLFLLLPIHTEVVANISGRGELLALFFSLLVLLEAAKGKTNFWLVGIWTLLAMGSKETAIAVLPLAFLVVYIKDPMPEFSLRRKSVEILKKYFRELSSAFVAICLYFFMRFFALGPDNFFSLKTSLIENPLFFADTGSRIATALKVLWMYFEKMLWPAHLCSDYSYNQIPVSGNFWTVMGFILLVSSIIVIPLLIKKKPAISFGLAIFVFSFLPVSNLFFPIGTIAGERLFFFPSLGFSLVIVCIVYKIYLAIENKKLKILVLAFVAVSLLSYGIVSARRQSVWLSEESLFLSAAQCSPNSVLSRSNSGAVYLLKGDLEKAEEELKISMNIKPIYSKGINNLGLVYFRKGEYDKAKELYIEALKQEYPYPGAYENLILLYLAQGDGERAKRWQMFLSQNSEKSIDTFIKNY